MAEVAGLGFEVRSAGVREEEEPAAVSFTDGQWWNLLALVRECGFDPGGEYGHLAYPDEGATSELDARAAGQLYIGVGAVLNQDTLPFAATWEEDDARVHFRWVSRPGYDAAPAPEDAARDAGSAFHLERARLRRLMDRLYQGPVLITRLPDREG